MLDAANPTFIVAFFAGLLSFVSPCCLPLYPSYLTYITGVSYQEMYEHRDQRAVRRRALTYSLFFVLGFSLIFVVLGMSASTIGALFSNYGDLIRQIGGILIIVMGLFLAGFLKIGALLSTKQLQLKWRPAGYLGAVIVGISFAAGWTPCIGPILASVLLIAASNPVSGMSLMLFYSIGFAIPFLIMAYTLGSVRWLMKYANTISKIGGIGMILMGVLLLTDSLTKITTWLIPLFGGFTGF
ncbi:cytochrome c-type biogenesis protein [Tumebacillus sp. BK434]|uniref:cytochrome c biogenesis CcdA family protein n=1 Tax=Tumebacillus sp. BK434 TaxID=2512169 RepID=UPI001045CB28|nr:cytochrome c biogenesis protein CcdA [Tumebacillus sp. BK434]TCP55523.1 cytochrome c-type biogenesis protein [Tumebacillus sp. BK434]